MTDLTDQIAGAYERMAAEAHYHPEALSDGFGNIVGKIDVPAQSKRYAHRWWADEEAQAFWVGCPNFSERPALIFTIEAARNICGGEHEVARQLLSMALAELEQRPPRRRGEE